MQRVPTLGVSGILSAAFALMVAVCSPAIASELPAGPLSGELTIGGTGAALGAMRRLGEEFAKSHPGVRINVLPSLGSGGGIKALVAGRLSVSVSSRPLTEAEQATGVQAREIAKTPLVFATSLRTPVAGVTLDELAALYAGRTTAWSDGTPVRPVLRPASDIDTQLVMDMSPALGQALQAAHQRDGKNVAITDTDSADELERIPGAIGTSTLSLIKSENRRLKALPVGGAAPSVNEQANPRYPYLKSIYLVVPANPAPLAQAFVRFLESPGATGILVQTGNIPAGRPK